VVQVITATAIDPANNTSEFSQCKTVIAGNLGLSGHVLDDSGNALAGVSVTVSGAAFGNTTTDGTGNYSFPNLVAGGNYTVTPSSSSYSFSPANQTFNSLNVDRIANFVGTQTIVSMTGKVSDANNVGINNVT